jgi:hypothetical protein
MDAGPAKQRRRYTAVPRTIAMNMAITGNARAVLDAFYRDTLQEGCLPFEWEDPATDEPVSFRFIAPPRYTLVAGGTVGERLWGVDLQLEILP